MKIIEHFLCGKENNPHTCEDGLVLGNHLVAVIDGVTSKGVHLWDGKTSGCYAKDILENYLRKDVEKQTAAELFKNLDRFLYESIQKQTSQLSFEELPRAAVIIYNDFYKEIWSYGDCQCRINGNIYKHSKKIDELNADLRAFCLEYQISQGATIEELKKNDLGRQEIQKNLLRQFAFENKKGYFGYPVLNGMGIDESMISRYAVSEEDTVVLASDGYPFLRESLKECEEELRYINENDPMCFRLYRSTKGKKGGDVSFDDRCFCKFVV